MTDPTPTRAEVEAAVEKLANSHLGMSLVEWNDVSNTILACAAENQALRERAEAADRDRSRLYDALAASQTALTEARRAEDAAWNDAIEAAGNLESIHGYSNAVPRHRIRALRRAAPTEGEA